MKRGAPRQGLRRQWADLSLEKKLSIVVVPLVLTFVGVLAPRFLGGGTGGSERKENLALVGEPVLFNSPDKQRNYGTSAELQIQVRNTGAVDALIHSAEVRVSRFEAAETWVMPQGELDVTGRYDIVLPTSDAVGKVVTANLAQRVPAGEPDRFSFDIRTAEKFPADGVPSMYLVDVLLYHDNSKQPLNVGQLIVALPFPLIHQFAFSDAMLAHGGLPDPECPTRNLTRLRAFLSLPAGRSPDLNAFLTRAQNATDRQSRHRGRGGPFEEQAMLVTTHLLKLIFRRQFQRACNAMMYIAVGVMLQVRNCPRHLKSLAAFLPPQHLRPPKIVEAHPGWFKFVAPTSADKHGIALITERIPYGPSRPSRSANGWFVTNVYDAAIGPGRR
jgi:hypothetical protein